MKFIVSLGEYIAKIVKIYKRSSFSKVCLGNYTVKFIVNLGDYIVSNLKTVKIRAQADADADADVWLKFNKECHNFNCNCIKLFSKITLY